MKNAPTMGTTEEAKMTTLRIPAGEVEVGDWTYDDFGVRHRVESVGRREGLVHIHCEKADKTIRAYVPVYVERMT